MRYFVHKHDITRTNIYNIILLLFAEVLNPPFEVTEVGWGEFEASIRVYFRDQNEAPIDLFHLIKLYPLGPPQPTGTLKKVLYYY